MRLFRVSCVWDRETAHAPPVNGSLPQPQWKDDKPMKTYRINGEGFATLEGFYNEISRVLVPDARWGHTLDAFNDLLRGGFGTPADGFVLVWENADLSRIRLGYAETTRQLERRLAHCHPSQRYFVKRQIAESQNHEGDTVFDWLVDILRAHGAGGEEAEDNVVLMLR